MGCVAIAGGLIAIACGGSSSKETTNADGGSADSATSSGATNPMADTAGSDPTAGTDPTDPTDPSGPTATGTDPDSTGGPPVGACGNADGQLLLPSMPWNTPITGAPVAADSQAVIDYLQANVGGDVRFQIDFSITVLQADASTPTMPFTPTGDFYSPDCDPAPIPVPRGGHLEGESGYACESDGDCHLIVVDQPNCRLYEQWRANITGGTFEGGCLAVWDLDGNYDQTLRGDYCTSADAAGLPIAALVFTADEIAAGSIDHAIRFIIPNADIRADEYVRPGTHSTPTTSGPDDAPPYAATLRLRADVDTSGLNPAAQVVAEAMKTYGIILADAGNVTFTAADDSTASTTWDAVGLGPHDLKALQWSDFERIDTGPTIVWSDGDCQRTPITK